MADPTPGQEAKADSGWPEHVREALDALVARVRAASDRSVAVFDFDNTCIDGDSGESLHYALCESFSYALHGPFWEQLEPEDGLDRLRATWKQYESLRESHAASDPKVRALGRELSLDLIAVYRRRFQRLGQAHCYDWAVTLHAGLHAEELERFAARFFAEELRRPRKRTPHVAPDGTRLALGRGIRVRDEMRRLIADLGEAGAEVWLVSATNEWALRAFAPHVGVPSERAIGNRCRVVDGVITAERAGPTTFREGKVEAIEQRIGARPVLVAGDTWSDAAMLDYASQLSLLIDRGDDSLRAAARERGWMTVDRKRLTPIGDVS